MYCYEYPRPALTVDALVVAGNLTDGQILLIERGKQPFAGMFALPGGFVDMDETLEQACIRELEEETGLKVGHMSQFRVFDAIDRDPRHRTVSVVFYVFIPEKTHVRAGDDASLAKWFPISQLPPLAFDHALVIESFLRSGTTP